MNSTSLIFNYYLLVDCRVPGIETFLELGVADREVTYIKDLITYILEIEVNE